MFTSCTKRFICFLDSAIYHGILRLQTFCDIIKIVKSTKKGLQCGNTAGGKNNGAGTYPPQVLPMHSAI